MAATLPLAKTYGDCSDAERLAYFDAYLAAWDVVNTAQRKFDTLVQLATAIDDVSGYKADSLEALRDLELLDNQYRAFKAGLAAVIPPPDQAVVDRIQKTSAQLAQIVAAGNTAQTILTLMLQGKAEFDALSA